MAILDVQAMVRRPQEDLDSRYSVEARPRNLVGKENSFTQHLKKMSQREDEPESHPPVRKDLPPKNTAFERPTFEQKPDLIVDANGGVGNLTPAQEKPNFQAKTGSDAWKSAEANQSVLASVETGSTQEPDKQSQDEYNELAPTSIGLVQPQWDLTGTPDSEESKTTSAVEIATLPAQGAGKQVAGQNQELLVAMIETAQSQVTEKQTPAQVETIQPLVAELETVQPQVAEKPTQGPVTAVNSISELERGLSQAVATRVPISGEGQKLNVQEGQGEEIRSDVNGSAISPVTEEAQEESIATNASTKVIAETNPQGEILPLSENPVMETEPGKAVVKSALSIPGNPLAVTENTTLVIEPDLSAEKVLAAPAILEGNIITEKEVEHPKIASKISDENRIKLQLLEKPLGDQANQKTEEPAVKDVKKIMEFENHRLVARKLIIDVPSLEEVAQETGAEEGKTLTLLDKTLLELARPGGEVGKAQPVNSTRPAVSPEELMEQIVKKVEMVGKQANSEMRIQLKPEFLGKMMIQIIVDDGVITARFTTESQHVKQILEANMNSLKQTLETNGLRVEKTEVNVQLDNGGNFNNNSEGNRQQLWQEMTSQGRNTGRYSQLSTGFTGEVEELGAYQRESDVPRVMNEGRVDFVI